MKDKGLDKTHKADIQRRKSQRDATSKAERLKQIEAMKQRLNSHLANQNRSMQVHTISEKTKAMARQQAQQMQTADKGREQHAPSR